MKRLVIIAEGETEESFVNQILCPYFCKSGIFNGIQCFKIKHSDGGVSKYTYIKKDILNVIYEKDVIVTTMIDFYRIPSDFPGFKESKNEGSHQEQVTFLEKAMRRDIEETQNEVFDNFIPYIQLHEFEALVFSSMSGVDALFERSEFQFKEFQKVIEHYPNPEDINNRPDTAPSVRLKKIITGYDKVLYGIGIVKETGMETTLSKCPHFNVWINKLKNSLL
jgi:hypothetical protein